MANTHVLAILIGAVLITSGCVSYLDGESEDALPEDIEEEPPEEFNETEEESPGETNETVNETDEETTEESPEETNETVNETDEETTEETAGETEVDRTVNIAGDASNSYNVSNVEASEGETVEFVYHHEAGTHDLVLEKDGEDVASTELLSESGETDSFTYTFEDDQDLQFYCSYSAHRAQGMEGTVTVN